MSIFDKELAEVTKEDLDELISQKISEDEFLEFKKTLPSNKREDKWIQGENSIGEKAITSLIKEIVAFANTSGGFLILGMEEEGNTKPVAKKINPLPRIYELSERLKRTFRNVIEPTLNSIRFHPIELEDGTGVLVIRVERSYLAPHRSLKDMECYIRRNDSSEKMTMREIKDIVISRFNSNQNTNSIFLDRKTSFEENCRIGRLPYDYHKEFEKKRIGIRFTFLPINEDLIIPQPFKLFDHNNTNKQHFRIKFSEDAKDYIVNFPFFSTTKNAIIRGVRFSGDRYDVEITEKGLVEVTLILQSNYFLNPLTLFVDWFFALFLNGLRVLEKIKTFSNSYNLEFGIEAQITSSIPSWNAKLFGDSISNEKKITDRNIVFPKYAYLGIDEINHLSRALIQDFYGMCGSYNNYEIFISSSNDLLP